MSRVALAAFGAVLAAMGVLGYLLQQDGYVTARPLGVCLLVVSVAAAVIYLNAHPFRREEQDDVWPDEPDVGMEGQAAPDEAWCPKRSVHPEHFFEFAGDTFRCPGKDVFVPAEVVQGGLANPEPMSVPCGSRRFHKAHEWIVTDEAGTEPEWCPGYTAKRRTASGPPDA